MTNTFVQRKTKIMIAVVAVIILLTCLASIVLYSVYIQRSDSPLIRRIGGALPIARIGSHTVTYKDFLESRDAIRVYMNSEAAKTMGVSGGLTAEGEKNAFERLVRQTALDELATDRKISVTDEEVRASFAQLVASASSTLPNVSQYLQDTFHWDEEQFRQKVIKPAILEERLAGTFSSSTEEQLQKLDTFLQERLNKLDVKKFLRF